MKCGNAKCEPNDMIHMGNRDSQMHTEWQERSHVLEIVYRRKRGDLIQMFKIRDSSIGSRQIRCNNNKFQT